MEDLIMETKDIFGNYPGKARNIDELRADILKAAKLILLCLSGMLAMQSATAQSRSEKKAQTA